jgi:hypothetical protein
MEPEFYELERFNGSVRAFLRQAYSYQLYFNLLRRNSAKAGQTPEQLRQARAPTVSRQIYLLPPVLLSSLEAQDLPLPRQVLEGHDVPGHVSRAAKRRKNRLSAGCLQESRTGIWR